MGYYTKYTIIAETEWKDRNDAFFAEIERRLCDLGIGYNQDTHSTEPTKWYEHEEDMRKLSSEFPTVMFKVYGNGENDEDIWVRYYIDGKMQHEMAVIQYPDFDKRKLK